MSDTCSERISTEVVDKHGVNCGELVALELGLANVDSLLNVEHLAHENEELPSAHRLRGVVRAAKSRSECRNQT